MSVSNIKIVACMTFILCAAVSIVWAGETAHRGKAVETHHQGNYSYMKLNVEDKEIVLTTPPAKCSATSS